MSTSPFRDGAALLRLEAASLSPFATPSSEARRRHTAAEEETGADYRLPFQRDRDRITHSRAFRRLKHKTQVFVPHVGDHPRTRLTHTLEVAQIGRTIARSLGLNEDLAEAAALGHDLGHTAFGHTGEKTLHRILTGAEEMLPPGVVAEVGAFKHNFQSLRVVDLLERRYRHPGLNLSDQVREAILKHTSWPARLPFPLPDRNGLELDRAAHLEGQAVAVADEIAQQTHDLEDGLRVGSVSLTAVTDLEVSRRVLTRLAGAFAEEPSQWRRQSLLIRGIIHHLVTDVLEATAARMADLAARHGVDSRERFLPLRQGLSARLVWFSAGVEPQFHELKSFIYQFIINHWQVNRQDWRARKVITALFRAYWTNPLTLPTYVLLRAKEELGFPFLRDIPFATVADEISSRYHASAGFARLVADHIAGMSDRFALEEYQSLEQPATEQRFLGDLR